MKTYNFDLVVSRDLTGEADSDRVFELFGGDVTPAVRSGTPLLMCSVEAVTFVEAVHFAVGRLRIHGYTVSYVQVEPGAVAA